MSIITTQQSQDARAIAFTRLIVSIIVIINLFLANNGFDPLPLGENDIYELFSIIFAAASTTWAWWKNNNVTRPAQEAQQILNEIKDSPENLRNICMKLDE